MSLLALLDRAQGGTFFANAGRTAGVPATEARQALAALCPAFAGALHGKAQADAEAFEGLLELIEEGDGDGLEDRDATTGAEAVSDGNAVLAEIYGTRNAAMAEARKLVPDLPELALAQLAPIAASAVLASIASQGARPMPLSAAAAFPEGGLFGTLVTALVRGAIQGAVRQLAPRRRRRRSYSSYVRRKKSSTARRKSKSRRKSTSRRRSGSTPSLEDIFRDILGTGR